MTPILPPVGRQRLAWLDTGDTLLDGRTVLDATRYKDVGVRLSDQSCYVEHKRTPYPRPLDELLPILPHPPARDITTQLYELRQMESQAGFNFYPQQLNYIAHLYKAGSGIIAAEVGCGKSVMTIGLIHLHRPRRALVLAPQGVMVGRQGMPAQWESEFARFMPWARPVRIQSASDLALHEPGIHFAYLQEALANDGGGWLRHIPPDHYDFIAVDESHIIQNRHALMAQALFRMEPRVGYALTATPLGNRVSDCWRVGRWLKPEWTYDLPGGAKAGPGLHVSPLVAYHNLSKVVAPIRKEDIRPDLPGITIHKVMVSPHPDTMRAIREIETSFTLPTGSGGQVERVRLTMMRNVCADDPHKVEAIARAGCQVGSQRVVVSARLEQTSRIVAHAAGRWGRIDSTAPKLRSSVATEFRERRLDELYLGIKCAYGYSFPDCSEIHIASLEWSYGTFAQAVGRVHRINSQHPVHAFVYLLAGTIEERMFDTVCTKECAAHLALYGQAA